MTALPSVSVVMGVYNGGESLSRTIDSVLKQDGVDLEFIIVDDGSTDATAATLQRHAREDGRIRVIRQDNAGLTAALVHGCEAARGEFIARQDAGGDLSLGQRLKRQSDHLLQQPRVAFVAGGTRFVGPDDEFLFDDIHTAERLKQGLGTLVIPGLRGPCHGSVMFRRDLYVRAGGYRRPFIVAQDVDLWLRLAELGDVSALPEVLYQSRQTAGGISHRMSGRQVELGRLAVQCAVARRKGEPEPALPDPIRLGSNNRQQSKKHDAAAFHYFVGSCLASRDPRAARRYFWQALKAQPWALRTWVRWVHPSLGSAG
jgi:hypothetical protein